MEKGEMGENATGRLTTYYVAECMEFNRYGEYREDICKCWSYSLRLIVNQIIMKHINT